MCELTDTKGDFWRRIHASIVEPVRFAGYVFHRRHETTLRPCEQALREKQAVRRADRAVRELRGLEANDKAVFETLNSVPFEIEYRRPHLRARLADAYRAGDHAELGRIVADEMRCLLEQQAEDSADDQCSDAENAERDALDEEAERAYRAITEGTP